MKTSILHPCIAWLLLLGTAPATAQQQPVWLSHFENGSWRGLRLVMDQVGNIYGTGQVKAPGMSLDGQSVIPEGASDILLMKLDSTGLAQWITRAGGSCTDMTGDDSYEIAYKIAIDAQGQHVVISGNYSSVATFGDHTLQGWCSDQHRDMFVAAYDPSGACLWANSVFNGYEPGGIIKLLAGPSAETYVFFGVGNSIYFPEANAIEYTDGGGVLAKYSSTGERLLTERIMLHGTVSDAEWSGDDLLVCGRFQASDSLWDMALDAQGTYGDAFLALVDPAGHVQWCSHVSTDLSAGFISCKRTVSGNIAVLGSYGGHAYFGTDTLTAGLSITEYGDTLNSSSFVALYDPTGTLLWVKDISSDTLFYTDGMDLGPDGSIYVLGHFSGELTVGTTTLHSDARTDMYLVKLDTLGNCAGALRAGAVSNLGSGSLLVNERGVFVSYNYFSPFSIGSDAINCEEEFCNGTFVAKFDGLSGFTGISSLAPPPTSGLLIYANPNNGVCTIELPEQLQLTSDLMLSVYDNTGQLVQRTSLGYSGGTIQLDISAQPQGVYHVELSDGDQRYSGSIVFE